VKNRKGHKTDDKDGWWLAPLLRHAKNRVQKVREDANVKLGNELTDLFGVSGQLMLEAWWEGKAQPAQMAQLAKRGAKKKIPEIVQALEGHRMSDHHRQMIRYSLKHLLFLEEQIAEMDRDITAKIEAAGLGPAWQRMQTVAGIQDCSAANILAETGADRKQFPSAQHLSWWAGVCPGNHRSAGKNKSSHTTGGNPWLRSALTECAWAAAATNNCSLQDKFWRVTSRSGGQKAPALIAVAQVMLTLIYHVLENQQPFQDRKAPPLGELQKQRMIRHPIRRWGKLGVAIPRLAYVPAAVQPPSRD
jgi:transposase